VTALALILAVALAPSAPAASHMATPAGTLLVIEAEHVQYEFKKHAVTFSGREPVKLTREDAQLTCKELVTQQDAAGKVESATCRGDVRLVRGERVLTCARAVFEAKADRVTCEGDPVLREGGSEAHGHVLFYDLGADEVRFEGKPGEPVRIQLPGDEVEARRKALAERRKEQRK
jgi:lipopolysaccharide export system protein LptA